MVLTCFKILGTVFIQKSYADAVISVCRPVALQAGNGVTI